MSPADVLIAVAIGLISGVLAGIFGVGGGIVMTPGIQVTPRGATDRGARDPSAGDLPDRTRRRARLPPPR